MRRFLVIGHKAVTSPDFSLKDLPGSAGRMDILVRSIRASFLVSHGLRDDVELYLVLLGPPHAPLTLRFTGRDLKHLNPDEWNTGKLVQKALATDTTGPVWQESTPGVHVAAVGLAELRDALGGTLYWLHEDGEDVRALEDASADATFLIGDHEGFTPEEEALLREWSARAVSVGPVSLQADDAVTLVQNEWDRRFRAA